MTDIKLPNIPRIPPGVNPEVRQALQAIRSWLSEIRAAGGFHASFESVSDAISELTPDPDEPYDETKSYPIHERTIPPTLMGLTAIGTFAAIVLTWDAYEWYDGAYVEIWRNITDDSDTARRIGTVAGGTTYTDHPATPRLANSYHYWIRLCSEDGTYGEFNASAGTMGQIANEPEYVLEILDGIVALLSSFPDVAVGGLADLTTAAGTSGTAIQDVGASFNQSVLNDNFYRLAVRVNEILARMNSYGSAWNDVAQ